MSCKRKTLFGKKKPIDENTKEIRYKNFEACGRCEFKDKCTKIKMDE